MGLQLASRYVRLIGARRWAPLVVLGLWLSLAVCGAALIPSFLRATVDDIVVPSSAPSRQARAAAAAHRIRFTAGVPSALTLLLAHNASAATLNNGPVQRFYEALQQLAQQTFPGKVMLWDGYFAALQRGASRYAQSYVAPMDRALLVSLYMPDRTIVGSMAKFLDAQCQLLLPHYPGMFAGVIGDAMDKDVIINSVERDLMLGDGIAMPISALVLGVSLRSFRFLVLPLLCLAVSALTSFGLMFFVAITIPIVSATMSLVTSVLVAFVFDYSLFTLTRFTEVVRERPSLKSDSTNLHDQLQEVLVEVLNTAGHTVAVSGGTLVFAFFALIFVPQPTVRGLGVGASVSLLSVVLVQLTLVPAIILLFPKFFISSTVKGTCHPRVPRFIANWWLVADESNDEETKMRTSKWYRLGIWLTTFPYNMMTILVICGAILPFALYAFSFPVSDTVILALPRMGRYAETIRRLAQYFGSNFLERFWFLLVPPAGTNVLDASFMDSVRRFQEDFAIASYGNITCSSLVSYAQASCTNFAPEAIRACLLAPVVPGCPDLMTLYTGLVAEGQTAVIVLVQQFPFDVGDALGLVWYKSALRFVDHQRSLGHFDVFLGGGEGWDGVSLAFDNLPLAMTLSFVGIFVLVGLAFRSVLIPLRTTLTIALTLAFVFGAAVLVYVHGILDWTHFVGFSSVGSILWMPPLVSFSIVTGLCLDYDIFLLVRIKEFKDEGLSTVEAIARGLWKTGSIVTSAGIIMTIGERKIACYLTLLSCFPLFNSFWKPFVFVISCYEFTELLHSCCSSSRHFRSSHFLGSCVVFDFPRMELVARICVVLSEKEE